MDKPKYIDAYKNARDLRDHIRKSDALVIELMAHPAATANSIMEMHEKMVRGRKHYREILRLLTVWADKIRVSPRYDPRDLEL